MEIEEMIERVKRGEIEYGMVSVMYGMGSMIVVENDSGYGIDSERFKWFDEYSIKEGLWIGSGKYMVGVLWWCDEFYIENCIYGWGGIVVRYNSGYDLVVRDVWVDWFERMSGLKMDYKFENVLIEMFNNRVYYF